MWICQTVFKFKIHEFLREISMLQNSDHLWQRYQKYSASIKFFLKIQLIREMELTHGNFILFCFIASISKFSTLTQFKFFFWYTVKPRKVSSWTYIFQLIFLVGICLGANAAFNLLNQVILFITFALYRLRYKFLFLRHCFHGIC